jgi:putative oxidoreductase
MTSTHHLGLLILRLAFSGMMLVHGIPKFLDILQGDFSFGDPIGIGATASKILVVIAEFICPLLIIIGYRTRLAAIPTIIAMLVAAFIAHADDPFSSKEKALLFVAGFLVIALVGPGKFAVHKK